MNGKRIIERGACEAIKKAVAERKSCISLEEWLGREEFQEKPLNVVTHAYEQLVRSLEIVEKLIKLVELELDEDPIYDNDMKEIMVTLLTVAATGILDPNKGEEIIGILSVEAKKKITEAVANGKMDKVMDILKSRGKEELVDAIFPKTGQV